MKLSDVLLGWFALVFLGAVVSAQSATDRILYEALEAGDYTRADEVLSVGADPNVRLEDDSPLLLYTSVSSTHRGVELLLQHGADVHATNRRGSTALIVASKWGRVDTVRILLRAGAQPAKRDRRGHDALYYASKGGHEQVVTLLEAALHRP